MCTLMHLLTITSLSPHLFSHARSPARTESYSETVQQAQAQCTQLTFSTSFCHLIRHAPPTNSNAFSIESFTVDIMLQANITLTYYVRLYDAERQIKMEAERRRRRRSMALASLTGEDLSKMDAAQLEQLRKLTSRKSKDVSGSNSRRPSFVTSNLQPPSVRKRRSNSLCVPGTSRDAPQLTSKTQDHLETAGSLSVAGLQRRVGSGVKKVGSGSGRRRSEQLSRLVSDQSAQGSAGFTGSRSSCALQAAMDHNRSALTTSSVEPSAQLKKYLQAEAAGLRSLQAKFLWQMDHPAFGSALQKLRYLRQVYTQCHEDVPESTAWLLNHGQSMLTPALEPVLVQLAIRFPDVDTTEMLALLRVCDESAIRATDILRGDQRLTMYEQIQLRAGRDRLSKSMKIRFRDRESSKATEVSFRDRLQILKTSFTHSGLPIVVDDEVNALRSQRPSTEGSSVASPRTLSPKTVSPNLRPSSIEVPTEPVLPDAVSALRIRRPSRVDDRSTGPSPMPKSPSDSPSITPVPLRPGMSPLAASALGVRQQRRSFSQDSERRNSSPLLPPPAVSSSLACSTSHSSSAGTGTGTPLQMRPPAPPSSKARSDVGPVVRVNAIVEDRLAGFPGGSIRKEWRVRIELQVAGGSGACHTDAASSPLAALPQHLQSTAFRSLQSSPVLPSSLAAESKVSSRVSSSVSNDGSLSPTCGDELGSALFRV